MGMGNTPPSMYYGRVSAMLSALNTRPTLMYCFDTSTSHTVCSSAHCLDCLVPSVSPPAPVSGPVSGLELWTNLREVLTVPGEGLYIPILNTRLASYLVSKILKCERDSRSIQQAEGLSRDRDLPRNCVFCADLRLQLYLGWTPRTCEPRSSGGGLTPRSTDTTRTSAQTITRWLRHSDIVRWLL